MEVHWSVSQQKLNIEAIMAKASMSATKPKQKEDWKGLLKSLLIALVLAIGFRTFFFEPFHIPSGSMKPTLLIGDYIFVSKTSYGYSRYSLPFGIPIIKGRLIETKPERGDVVVFKKPGEEGTNYIKRLVGYAGDKIQVKQGVLYINGDAVYRQRIDDFVDDNFTSIPQYIETLPNGVSYRILDQNPQSRTDNTIEYTVPKGHYFFMGDNRDNSQDSRILSAVGYVPEINLVGKAKLIFFSKEFAFWEFWKWFGSETTKRSFITIE